MNTNGTGSGDTWERERRGWALLAEQQGDEEREAVVGGAKTPGPPEQAHMGCPDPEGKR